MRVHEKAVWHCVCDCGTECWVVGQLLGDGRTTSCGCFRREQLIKRNTTHGMSKSRAYMLWKAMMARCFNVNNSAYSYYGGREDNPITVCEYYLSFENWYADRGDPPDGLSQDRIDNNRGYEPGNLQWASRAQQLANRRPYRRKARRSDVADIRAYADALARAAGGAP
jgi:hypothetical protein